MGLCTQCGAHCPEEASFCEHCGFRIRQVPSQPSQSPAPQPPAEPPAMRSDAAMSVGAYFGSLLLMSIPIIGFVACVVWAISSGESMSRKNLARAMLILKALFLILLIGLILTASNMGSWFF